MASNLDLGIYRIASQEAVSLDTRLAVLALRRAQVESSIMDRLARAVNAESPPTTAIAVDKKA